MRNWREFFELSKHKEPSILLEKAIPFVKERNAALDIGAGSLRDSKFMLSMGFREVTALDLDPVIKEYADKIPRSLLKFRITRFENLHRLPSRKFDLVNASFSLPFAPPPHLPRIIRLIKKSLNPNSIFCGQLFGPKDSWNIPDLQDTLTFTDRSEVKNLFSDCEIIYLKERKFKGVTIDGIPKNWHVFDFIIKI